MKLPDNIKDAEPWAGDDRLQPGLYVAAVAECKEETSKSGNPMLVITWRVAVGEWKGAEIRDWVTVIESTAGRVVALLQSLGVEVPASGVMEASALVGKRATIVVRSEPYTGQDGERKEGTKVKGYKPADALASDVPDDGAAFTHAPAGNANDDVPF